MRTVKCWRPHLLYSSILKQGPDIQAHHMTRWRLPIVGHLCTDSSIKKYMLYAWFLVNILLITNQSERANRSYRPSLCPSVCAHGHFSSNKSECLQWFQPGIPESKKTKQNLFSTGPIGQTFFLDLLMNTTHLKAFRFGCAPELIKMFNLVIDSV